MVDFNFINEKLSIGEGNGLGVARSPTVRRVPGSIPDPGAFSLSATFILSLGGGLDGQTPVSRGHCTRSLSVRIAMGRRQGSGPD